jgi:ACS family sodium-dependent inorganic phosphate cotransporter-like MFS transporter 9
LLSSFFYGYPLTQILSGFLSDKIGGDLIIYYSCIIWGTLTFLTPYVTVLSDNKYQVLAYIAVFRCVTGAFQGFQYPGTSSLVSKRIGDSEKAFTFSFITSGQHLG